MGEFTDDYESSGGAEEAVVGPALADARIVSGLGWLDVADVKYSVNDLNDAHISTVAAFPIQVDSLLRTGAWNEWIKKLIKYHMK